jgi:hypothetical protein
MNAPDCGTSALKVSFGMESLNSRSPGNSLHETMGRWSAAREPLFHHVDVGAPSARDFKAVESI